MRVKEDFFLKRIAGMQVVVPVGTENVNFQGMITLNETGAFLWELLTEERSKDKLIAALLEEYDVTEEKAAADIDRFIAKLQEADLLV